MRILRHVGSGSGMQREAIVQPPDLFDDAEHAALHPAQSADSVFGFARIAQHKRAQRRADCLDMNGGLAFEVNQVAHRRSVVVHHAAGFAKFQHLSAVGQFGELSGWQCPGFVGQLRQ